MSPCPCGSGLDFEGCCGPLLSGDRQAGTAESLMRSRYCAYVVGNIAYLTETLEPDHRHDHDAAAARRWAERSVWEGLEVQSVQGGGTSDQDGTVEFVASFSENGIHKRHHEIGRFRRREGRWYYVEGKLVPPRTERHQGEKVGRNDPCPCGSGRKFKKCCGS